MEFILKYLRGNGNVELELDPPFLDYVTRRYKGEVAEELSAFYADRPKGSRFNS